MLITTGRRNCSPKPSFQLFLIRFILRPGCAKSHFLPISSPKVGIVCRTNIGSISLLQTHLRLLMIQGNPRNLGRLGSHACKLAGFHHPSDQVVDSSP